MKSFSETTSQGRLPCPIGNVMARSLSQTWAVARLTIRNLVLGKQTLLIILLACVPVGVALILTYVLPEEGRRAPSYEIFTGLFVGLYVYFVLLLTAIFYGASLIADERSDRTITFLLIRPLPREAIVAGKFVPYVVSASAILLASLATTYLIFSRLDEDMAAFRNAVPFLKCAQVVVLGLAAYGGLFTFFGATFKRPVIVAFAYCFVWESILPYLPVFLKKATLMHYVQSLIPNWVSEGGILAVAVEPADPARAVWTLLACCATFLILTTISLRMKEYAFEREKEV
jgi:ABC-2 type transport system permease protein